jgi:hypothetical protein
MPLSLLVSSRCEVAAVSVAVAYLFLVRSMRIAGLVAVFLVAGCAAQFQVVGPCAGDLSPSDIQHITALITPDRDTSRTYIKLEAIRPDRVRVEVGGFARSGGVWTSEHSGYAFTAFKQHGRWVGGSEAEVFRTITVY